MTVDMVVLNTRTTSYNQDLEQRIVAAIQGSPAADAMEAWQSTCPRHTIWEDAVIDGFIQVKSNGTAHESKVTLTARGRAIIQTVQPLE